MSREPDKKPAVNVVLCWHMHQPQYQDQFSHEFHLPWTYLHAIKDYADMAAIVEAVPQSRVVVNFSPVLLDQINDYVQQFKRYFQSGESFNDKLLSALAAPTIGPTQTRRHDIVKQCVRANKERLVQRFKPYQELVVLAQQALTNPGYLDYLDEQYFFDLLVWYHLVWMGETVRDTHPVIQRLIAKAKAFTISDRRELLGVIDELLRSVVPRYRHLAQSGQMEISVTPDKHPIVPLMVDFKSTLDAMPDAPLPQHAGYPDGESRARHHIARSLEIFSEHFGFRPSGCWPSEGSVSDRTLELMAEHEFSWVASGGSVLHNSLNAAKMKGICIHHGFQLKDIPLACYFRDDNLSDLIGFTYSGWDETDAVNNMVHHIENIRTACKYQPDTIIPIILDGENCWEYYPNNGYGFLTKLYQRLAEHPDINMTTFQRYAEQHSKRTVLPHIVSGSWVYGSFSTWIGDPAKNRAWDLLCQAKLDFDRVMSTNQLNPELRRKAEEQMAICEGSDWFWWFGDYNPAEAVSDFDILYRTHLRNLYRFLGEPCPPVLSEIISQGHGTPENSGVMRRGQG